MKKILEEKGEEVKREDEGLDLFFLTDPTLLIGIVYLILILYFVVGIVGYYNLIENTLLKNFKWFYIVTCLFGLIIPIELLAIFYKIKGN